MRRAAFVAVMCGLLIGSEKAPPAVSVVSMWFPVAPGDRWVYQHEARDAGTRGMANPSIERWKTEETIDSVTHASDGMLVVERVRAYEQEMLNGWSPANDATKRLTPVERIRIHQNCVYRDGDTYRAADGEDTPSLCFPMTVTGTWGRSAATSPTLEAVWHVRALNGDPFGIPGAPTYHAFAYEGSGTVDDLWYAEGIGLVQKIVEHHGTYSEDRSQLLSTTLAGQTHRYSLTPAKTVPLSEADCLGILWRHFVHADGTAFVNPTDCVAAARHSEDKD